MRTMCKRNVEVKSHSNKGNPCYISQKHSLQQLLHNASHKQTQTNRLAMTGKGVDRLMFMLYLMSVGMKMPSDFLDDYISRKWTLSTSQVEKRLCQFCETTKSSANMT